MKAKTRIAAVTIILAGTVASVSATYRWINHSRFPITAISGQRHVPQILGIQDEPLMLPPLAASIFTEDSLEATLVSRELAHPRGVSADAAAMCHVLRLYHQGVTPLPELASGQEIIRALLNQPLAESTFGEPLLIPTRYGLRFKLAGKLHNSDKGESHRDSCLAMFAELGLPKSTSFESGNAIRILNDLLNDSVQTFDLDASENAWTAIAYALYLAPDGQWTNREGRTYSFDDLATNLLNRKLHMASCGGVHVLYALTLIHRADLQTGCLSAAVRQAVTEKLRHMVSIAKTSQNLNGAWPWDWHQDTPAGQVSPLILNSPVYARIVTGHLLEWLEYLPIDMQPEPSVYRKAAAWICRDLTVSAPTTMPTAPMDICPWTHEVCSIRNLIDSSSRHAIFSIGADRKKEPVGG